MKFLVDNQLPAALARYLHTRGFDCEHVLDVGLDRAFDIEICRYAEVQDRIVITKDEDFLHLASRPQAKIKVLWIRLRTCRTSTLLAAFERSWPTIESSLKAADWIVEIR